MYERSCAVDEVDYTRLLPVFILESPGDEDLRNGRREGEALSQMLKMGNVPVDYQIVTSSRSLIAALEQITDIFISENDEYWGGKGHLFLHISAHGIEGGNGIRLTSGETVPWEQLELELRRMNQEIGYLELDLPASGGTTKIARVMLCMSSCYGASAQVMHSGGPCPYTAVVGPVREIGWFDALTAFMVFYYQALHNGVPIPAAVRFMNQAIDLEGAFSYIIGAGVDAITLEDASFRGAKNK